jgi:dTDP-4-dehydrorhamnose 3,5-epimerase
MIFKSTKLRGVFEIALEPKSDQRGFFARTWCENEFREKGLNPRVAQCSVSFNAKKGTLRGMHFQADPLPEAKTVRCTRGSIYDVVLDLRPESPTFKCWTAVTLSAADRNAIYVPEGYAHGFLTLEDDTEVFYHISEFYRPELATGVRWNDPAFGIVWPSAVEVISDRDNNYPNFESK